eukprot:UN16754
MKLAGLNHKLKLYVENFNNTNENAVFFSFHYCETCVPRECSREEIILTKRFICVPASCNEIQPILTRRALSPLA